MTHKASILPFFLEEFWIMSHLECRLNQRFWRSKKVVQVVQIGGRGDSRLMRLTKLEFDLAMVELKTVKDNLH